MSTDVKLDQDNGVSVVLDAGVVKATAYDFVLTYPNATRAAGPNGARWSMTSATGSQSTGMETTQAG